MIHWILFSVVTFGLEANLSCIVPNFNQNVSRAWRRGDNLETIVLNGISVNDTKYKEHLGPNGFVLNIRHFSSNDVNIPYACSYNFDLFNKNLTINDTTFQTSLTNQNHEKTFTSKENRIFVTVRFQRVFPKPKCELNANGQKQHLTTKEQRQGIFLDTTFSFAAAKDVLTAGNCELNMICNIGSLKTSIIEDADYKFLCVGMEEKNIAAVIAGTLVSALVLFVIAIVLIKMGFKRLQQRCGFNANTVDQPECDIPLNQP